MTVSACVLGLSAGAASAAEAPGDDTLSARLHQLSSPELRTASRAEQADAVSLLNRGAGSLLRDGGALVVEIRTAGDPRAAVPALRAAGAEIAHVSDEHRTVTASVGEGELRGLASVERVDYVEEVITPMTGAVGEGDPDSGAINTCPTGVVSEGNVQLKAGAARTQFDVDGSGVKVGVLSDSYDTKPTASTHAADDVATGDLPGAGNPCGRTDPIQVLDDSAVCNPPPCGDEGRAMLQIVHDISPGSPLAFATAFGGQALFASNIRALASSGAKVIVDDIIYFTEPAYQDGIIANAVRDVTQQGVSYFSMAFNNNGLGRNSYEAPNGYRSMPCPAQVLAQEPGGDDSCMDFDPGPGTDPTFDMTLAGGGSPFRLSLHWGEPQSGVTNDFDAYVFNPDTTGTVSLAAESDNLASQAPVEFASFDSGGGARQLVIRRFAGTGTPRIKFISNDNGANTVQTTQAVAAPDVQGPTINGHNGTASAQSVAAVPFNNSATVEPFSSRGPVTHLFGPVQTVGAAPALTTPQVLSKPDVSATDRGINTFFGSGNRFSGTSAAAPHAAAVGALQLEANPALSNTQVKDAQKATARPVGAFGPLDMGAGLIDAQAAIGSQPPAGPTVAFGSTPGTTNSPTLSFPFTATGDLRTVTCQVDAGAQQPCASPFSTPLPTADGPHSVTARATDYFGQTAQAQAPFTVDTTGPATDFDKTPKDKTSKPKAKFAYSSEPGASFECALDRKPFKACTDRFKKKVKPGKHKFRVQATDALGNTGPVESDRWKLKRP